MDTAKLKAPASTPEEEQTGVFRRPPAAGRTENSTTARNDGRRRRNEDARHEAAAESPHADPELEVGSLQTSEVGGITYDAKGDPVWEWRVDVPRRRQDDSTIDLLKCLDVEDLRLEDEANEADQGINPYDTAVIRLRK